VSEGLGVGFFRHRHQNSFFLRFERKNANKVGFRTKKRSLTPQNLGVGVTVRFSDTKNSGVGVGKTDTKKCWCRVSNLTLTPTPMTVSLARLNSTKLCETIPYMYNMLKMKIQLIFLFELVKTKFRA
jgi:hypothetical protein